MLTPCQSHLPIIDIDPIDKRWRRGAAMQMMGPGGISRPGSAYRPPQGVQSQLPDLPGQDQQAPTAPPQAPPGGVVITRGQFAFQLGQMLKATVAEEPTQEGQVRLQFGDKLMTAFTDLTMAAGDQVLLQVQGQDKEKVTLALVRHESFSEMAEGDVSSALMDMNQPPNETNMGLAKGMVEMGVPLTQQDFQDLQQALAQLPEGSSNPQDVALGRLPQNGPRCR